MMKKMSKKILVLALGAFLAFGVAGIGNASSGQAAVKKTVSQEQKLAKKRSSKLVGTWRCDYDLNGATLVAIYKFNKNGSGTYSLAGEKLKFTYKDSGKVVTIRFKDASADMKLKYKIKGQKFIYKDITGQKVVFIKQ